MVFERSRSKRRVKVKTPGGKVVIHYRSRKKASPKCSKCKSTLKGVSHAQGIASTKRTPSRPFGGVLCSKCSRITIKERVAND